MTVRKWYYYVSPLQPVLFLTHSNPKAYKPFIPACPWFDDRGKPVSAHGANIIGDNGRYYLFGEAHTDTSNAFEGFNCYSSADLYNWKFERIALPAQSSGKPGPNRDGLDGYTRIFNLSGKTNVIRIYPLQM
jgi:hypothetical protein